MKPLHVSDPAHLGPHRILARIGAGGMGQVYLGRSPGGRLLAVKVVHDDFAESAEADEVLARFRREVETVGRVRSAYTAALVDCDVENRPYWLATEYVPGPTLAAAVQSQGPGGLPERFVPLLFAALAEGLADVHARGVSHRDLKPQNIILSADGPRLIDFGIAHASDRTALTRVGQTVGSLGYTAPEVMTDGLVGPAADVFALGATMAYAVTGRGPFGENAAGVVYRSLNGEIDLVGVEEGLAGLITACVAVEPGERPDPGEIIRRCDVRTALTDHPVYRQLVGDAPRVAATVLEATSGLSELPVGDGKVSAQEAVTVAAAPRTLLAPPDLLAATAPVPAPEPPRGRGVALASAALAALVTVVGLVFLVLLPGGSADLEAGAEPESPATGAQPSADSVAESPEEPAGPQGQITGMADKCVHVANSDTENGAVLQLWTCNSTDAQRWTVLGDGRLQALGKCMDVEWSGVGNGTPIRLWECNGSTAQQWESQEDGTLKNPGSGRCLDLTDWKTENGTPLILFDCNATANQIWRLPG
ncbi:ricin-type beta-trefoil lectin domain protein [Streptomyces sp. NPDC093085]|uniref:protein kinase domain-containing protein n=1 Tax=Streptomyces sp. NPDC093085 TaxID=3155068 RepID=UPI003429C22C